MELARVDHQVLLQGCWGHCRTKMFPWRSNCFQVKRTGLRKIVCEIMVCEVMTLAQKLWRLQNVFQQVPENNPEMSEEPLPNALSRSLDKHGKFQKDLLDMPQILEFLHSGKVSFTACRLRLSDQKRLQDCCCSSIKPSSSKPLLQDLKPKV